MSEATPEQYEAMSFEDQVKYMYEKVAEAEAVGEYATLCMLGEPVFWVEGDHALRPGHIYSKAGVDEFQISGYCEYHFDEITKDPEDDEEPV